MNFPVGFDEYRDECNTAYKEFKSKLPHGDQEAYDRAVKPIFDYCSTLSTASAQPSQETRKGIVARMHAAKDQFTGLVWLVSSHLMSF
jgi:hypothetical protein